MSETSEPPKTDVVTKTENVVEETGGFLTRHWKLAVFIGICIFLAPVITAIIQIFKMLGQDLAGIEDAIQDAFGKIEAIIKALEQACSQHPGSWQCFLLGTAKFLEVVFPLMAGFFQLFGAKRVVDWFDSMTGGTAADLCQEMSVMEGGKRSSRAIKRAIIDDVNFKVKEAIETHDNDPKNKDKKWGDDPKKVKALTERFIKAGVTKTFLRAANNSLNVAQQHKQDAFDRAQQAEIEQADKEVDDGNTDKEGMDAAAKDAYPDA